MTAYEARETTAYLLKNETAGQHRALEDWLAPRLQALNTPEQYVALLKGFYCFTKPVENLIEQQIDEHILPDIRHRRKADLILQDLTFSKTHTAPIPLTSQLPRITNVAEALGAMYVLEGSTLGGRGITRLLLKNTSLQLQLSQVQFFNGYGDATGPMWMEFLKTLNNQGVDSGARAQMIATANETFALFKIWLQNEIHD